MASLNFDANQVEPLPQGYELIPVGTYLAIISDSEMRPNKAGTGSYLLLTFSIIEGEHKGKKIWARLNLSNPSVVTVQIARAELSAICRAVGVLTPKDSVELHNLPLSITVRHRRRADTGEIVAEIKSYASRNGFCLPPQTNNTPPWRR